VGGQKFFWLAPLAKLSPHFQNRGAAHESIPRSMSCDAECSVSELPIGPWHDEITTACRSEGGSSGNVGSGR